MKKKLLSLILTVVMTGVLAGCAEKAPAGAQSQTTGNGAVSYTHLDVYKRQAGKRWPYSNFPQAV